MITLEPSKTLPALFRERVKSSPQQVAYRYFNKENNTWQHFTWAEMETQVAYWQLALLRENLVAGDKVAIMLRNSPQWVMFDQAALGLGLITVPLYVDDRPDNVAYILEETETKLLLLEGALQWKRLHPLCHTLNSLRRILVLQLIDIEKFHDERLTTATTWLVTEETPVLQSKESVPEELATIVYTSGTTGRPKGVMLSHRNIVFNAQSIALAADNHRATFNEKDVFLSFLPLSHMLERTAGYYLPMLTGGTVAYARSVPQLGVDLVTIRPTVLISVPRIYEQVFSKIQGQLSKKSTFIRFLFNLTVKVGWKRFEYQQKRAYWHPLLLLWPLLGRTVAKPLLEKFGGQLRLAISGGAALPFEVGRIFIALGLHLVQGYGLTETSPVVSVNLPDDNILESIGPTIPEVQAKLSEHNELLTKSPSVMLGYWKNPQATEAIIDSQGWLHTGDLARCDEKNHWYIIGRIKDILVMINGEKISPVDIESSILTDGLFAQVMVIGEGKPYLSALVVLEKERWLEIAQSLSLDPEQLTSLQDKSVHKTVLARIEQRTKNFPGYSKIRRIALFLEPWTVENGLLTPTLKMKRAKIIDYHQEAVENLYVNRPSF